jgi:PTEN induced putative kinase 1
MEKGGNAKLMAPEVSAAFPGRDSWLDFRCSDLWAAGTLAYEIFAGANPFYTDLFDSRNYHESELPVLPNTVPPVIKNVIHGMLQKEPRKRPSSAVISHLLSLWLWAPVAWQQQVPDNITIKRWIVQFTARQILKKLSADDMEWQQKALFLRNLKWCHLEAALEMLIPTAQA